MAQSGISILVVDDEIVLRTDIACTLEDEGFIVFEASNADEAIQILEAHHQIRLIFTDIDMPGSMDGLELAEAARARWPSIKLIVTSGHRCMSENALPVEGRFFSKPYDHLQIARTMRDMLMAR